MTELLMTDANGKGNRFYGCLVVIILNRMSSAREEIEKYMSP